MGQTPYDAVCRLLRSHDPRRPRRQAPGRRRPQAIASRLISSEAPDAAGDAAGVLEDGGVVVLPTDTVYGIAALLRKEAAVRRIFSIKRRPADKPLAVLAATPAEAMALGHLSPEAQAAAKEGWPGALTVVVPATRPLPQLGGDGSTVGLRVPDRSFALDVLRRCGPLAATSANLSGEPEGQTIEELRRSLGDAVDLYVDGGRLASKPSRVVSFAGPASVLRQ